MNRLFFLNIGLFLLFIGCSYDSDEDLYPDTACNTNNLRYSVDIKAIINTHCISCHSTAANQGNVKLENHSDILKYSNNGSLVGSIKHASPYVAMPIGAPKMSDCNISKIEAWVKAGSPNN